jgi:hypothetical protein
MVMVIFDVGKPESRVNVPRDDVKSFGGHGLMGKEEVVDLDPLADRRQIQQVEQFFISAVVIAHRQVNFDIADRFPPSPQQAFDSV